MPGQAVSPGRGRSVRQMRRERERDAQITEEQDTHPLGRWAWCDHSPVFVIISLCAQAGDEATLQLF